MLFVAKVSKERLSVVRYNWHFLGKKCRRQADVVRRVLVGCLVLEVSTVAFVRHVQVDEQLSGCGRPVLGLRIPSPHGSATQRAVGFHARESYL